MRKSFVLVDDRPVTLEILTTYCTVRYMVGTIYGTALEWVNFITGSPHCLTVCSCVFDYPDARTEQHCAVRAGMQCDQPSSERLQSAPQTTEPPSHARFKSQKETTENKRFFTAAKKRVYVIVSEIGNSKAVNSAVFRVLEHLPPK